MPVLWSIHTNFSDNHLATAICFYIEILTRHEQSDIPSADSVGITPDTLLSGIYLLHFLTPCFVESALLCKHPLFLQERSLQFLLDLWLKVDAHQILSFKHIYRDGILEIHTDYLINNSQTVIDSFPPVSICRLLGQFCIFFISQVIRNVNLRRTRLYNDTLAVFLTLNGGCVLNDDTVRGHHLLELLIGEIEFGGYALRQGDGLALWTRTCLEFLWSDAYLHFVENILRGFPLLALIEESIVA